MRNNRIQVQANGEYGCVFWVRATGSDDEKKRKPTERRAESISGGDMEETVLSINPYLIHASLPSPERNGIAETRLR